MKSPKTFVSLLATGMMLAAAAPVLADSFHDRGYERNHHSAPYRDQGRHGYRDRDRHHVVVVDRPYVVRRTVVVERPVYYYREAAPAPGPSLGAVIGAAVGVIIDNRQ